MNGTVISRLPAVLLAALANLFAPGTQAADFASTRPAARVEYWQQRQATIDAQVADAVGLRAVKLVFVGDLCDRGPDSPAVIEHVQRLMDAGRACAVIGNHEINLLREEAKDGSGWAFARRADL